MRRINAALTALAIALPLAAAPALAAEINLKLSHFAPPAFGMHSDFLVPWAKDLESCTKGKVAVQVFPGGTQLGNVAKQQEQVMAGVVDFAHGLHGIPRGRFPGTSLIETPFIVDSAAEASQALWTVYKQGLLDAEYKGLKVLALHAHNPGAIHTAKASIKKLEDLKGLRLRTPSPAVSLMLEYLNAIPAGLPPGQVYEALEKGTLDGTVFGWPTMTGYNLAEVTTQHLDARFYTASFYFVMSQRRFDKLPKDVQTCIDKLSGETLVAKFGDWWNAWDKPGIASVKARGNTITTPSAAERNQWRETLKPAVDAYIKQVEASGLSNAREIYDALKAAAEAAR